MYTLSKREKDLIYDAAEMLYLHLPDTADSSAKVPAASKSDEDLLHLVKILEVTDSKSLGSSVVLALQCRIRRMLNDAVNGRIVPSRTAVYTKIALHKFLNRRTADEATASKRDLGGTGSLKDLIYRARSLIAEALQQEEDLTTSYAEGSAETCGLSLTFREEANILLAISELSISLKSIIKLAEDSAMYSLAADMLAFLEKSLQRAGNITSWTENFRILPILKGLNQVISYALRGDHCREYKASLRGTHAYLERLIYYTDKRQSAIRVVCVDSNSAPKESLTKVKIVDDEHVKTRSILDQVVRIQHLVHRAYYSIKETNNGKYDLLIHNLKEDTDFLCISELSYVSTIDKTALAKVISKIARKTFSVLCSGIFPSAHEELYEAYQIAVSLAQSLPAVSKICVERHNIEVGKILDRLLLVDRLFVDHTNQCKADVRVIHARILVEGCILKLANEGLDECFTAVQEILKQAVSVSRHAFGADSTIYFILRHCVDDVCEMCDSLFVLRQCLTEARSTDAGGAVHLITPKDRADVVHLVPANGTMSKNKSDRHECDSFSSSLGALELNAQFLLNVPADAETLLNPSLLSGFKGGYSLSSILGMCPRTWELLKALSNVLCMTTLLMEEYQTSPSTEKKLLLHDAVKRLQQTKDNAGYLHSDAALMIFKTVLSTLNSMAQVDITDIVRNHGAHAPNYGTCPVLHTDGLVYNTVNQQAVTSSTENLLSFHERGETVEQTKTECDFPLLSEGYKEHTLAKSPSSGAAESCDSIQNHEILNLSVFTSFESDLRKGNIAKVERNLSQACEFLDFIIKTHHEDDDGSPTLFAAAFLCDVKEALHALYSASKKLREGCAINASVLGNAQRLIAVLRHELRSGSGHEDLDLNSMPSVMNIRYNSVLRIVAHIRGEKQSLSFLRNKQIRSHMHEVLGKIELALKGGHSADNSTQLPGKRIGELALFSLPEDCVDANPGDGKSLGKVQVRAKEILQYAKDNVEELHEMLRECTGWYAGQALRDIENAFSSLAHARSLVVTSVNRSILNAAVSNIAAAMDAICGSYYKSVLPAAPLALSNSIKSCRRLLCVLAHAFSASKCEERDRISSDSAMYHLEHATRALQHLDINSDVIKKHAVAPVVYRSVHACLCALYDIMHEDKCEHVGPDTLRHNVHFNVAIYACKALENALLKHMKLCSLQKETCVASHVDLSHSEMQALNLYEASINVIDASKDLCSVTKAVLLQMSNNLRRMVGYLVLQGIHVSECIATTAALERMCRTVTSITLHEEITCRGEEEGVTGRGTAEYAILSLNKASTLITRAMCSIDGDYKIRDETIWDPASCIPLLPGEISKSEYDILHNKNIYPDGRLPPHCDLNFVETPSKEKKGFRQFCIVVIAYVKAFFRWIFYPVFALYGFCVRTNEKRQRENVRDTLEKITHRIADLPELLESRGVNNRNVVGAIEELTASCKNNIELAGTALRQQSYDDILDASCRMIVSDIQVGSALDMTNTLPEAREVSESLKSLRDGIRNLETLLPVVANCMVRETRSNVSGYDRSRGDVTGIARPDVFLTYEVLSAGWWGSKNSHTGIKCALTRIHRIFGAKTKFAVHPALIGALCSQHDVNTLNWVCTNLVVTGAHGDSGLQKVLDIFANSIRSHAGERLHSVTFGSHTSEETSFKGTMISRVLTSLIGNSCQNTKVSSCAKYSLQHCRIDNIIEALCTIHDSGDAELDFLLHSCRDGIVSENTFARCLRFCSQRHAVVIERYISGCSRNHHISSLIENIPSMSSCKKGVNSPELVKHRNKAIADVQRQRQILRLQRDKYGKKEGKPVPNKNLKRCSKAQSVASLVAKPGDYHFVLDLDCISKEINVELGGVPVVISRTKEPAERGGTVLYSRTQYSGGGQIRSASYEEGCCYETAMRYDVGKSRGVMVVSSVVAVCMSEEGSRGILANRNAAFRELDNGKTDVCKPYNPYYR